MREHQSTVTYGIVFFGCARERWKRAVCVSAQMNQRMRENRDV